MQYVFILYSLTRLYKQSRGKNSRGFRRRALPKVMRRPKNTKTQKPKTQNPKPKTQKPSPTQCTQRPPPTQCTPRLPPWRPLRQILPAPSLPLSAHCFCLLTRWGPLQQPPQTDSRQQPPAVSSGSPPAFHLVVGGAWVDAPGRYPRAGLSESQSPACPLEVWMSAFFEVIK